MRGCSGVYLFTLLICAWIPARVGLVVSADWKESKEEDVSQRYFQPQIPGGSEAPQSHVLDDLTLLPWQWISRALI